MDFFPSGEIAELRTLYSECGCCKCDRCDFRIGSISCLITGEYSYEAEYESPTDPGYYDHIEYNFSWGAGPINIAQKETDYLATGIQDWYFWWNNYKWMSSYTIEESYRGACYCGPNMNPAELWVGKANYEIYTASGPPWNHYAVMATGEYYYEVRAVEDPLLILSSGYSSYSIPLSFGFIYDKSVSKWQMFGNLGWIGTGIFIEDALDWQGNPLGTGNFASWAENSTEPCGHPKGSYGGSWGEILNISDGPTYTGKNIDITVDIDVLGDGLMNCVQAPIEFPIYP